jgi:membrane protein YdbS with pleckstrin-like domain
VLLVVGFVSWLVTRWRIDGDDLRIETGLLRRQSLRFPLAQVQAVDVVRPGLARLFRVAELRLRMAGSTGGTARLAYLPEREVEPLRTRLLALAHEGVDGVAPAEEVEERVLASVPTGRLAASILLSDVGFLAIAILAGLLVTAVEAPAATTEAFGGSAVWVIAGLTMLWRRFNQEYKLTVAEAPDGLRLRSGLVALTSETIRPGRVQAVRMVEPFVWRRLGWCRRSSASQGRRGGTAYAAPRRAAGREPRPRAGAARAHRAGRAHRQAAAVATSARQEPAALPLPLLWANRHLRRDDDGPHPAGDRLGAARQGSELPSRPGPAAAAATARLDPSRHGGPKRPRESPRPRRR